MRTWITLLAATTLAASALAEEPPPDYTREGWYLQAQGVYAIPYFQDFDPGNDAGFNVAGGWRGWEMFAGEFEFEWINRFPGPSDEPDFRTYDVALMFKLYPLARLFDASSTANRFQPWLKAGPGWQYVERRGGGQPNRDRGDFAGRVGMGIDIYLTPHWVLVGSGTYQLPTSDTDRYQYLAAGGGFQYRFGGD